MLLTAGSLGHLATTDDPANGWDLDQLGESEVRALVFVNDLLFAGTASGEVYTSSAGTGWSLVHTFDSAVITAAALPYSRDVLFALAPLTPDGPHRGGGFRDGYGWYEWNHWEAFADVYALAGLEGHEAPSTLEQVRAIAGADGGVVLTADGWYANPGWLQWTERPIPFDGQPILALARGDGLWVAGGGAGKLAVSSDGFTWEAVDSRFSGSCIYALAYDFVLGWLAVGAEGRVSKSLDALTWESVDMASESECAVDLSGRVAHRWLSATASGDCWLIVGDGNTVATLCECPDVYYYAPSEPSVPEDPEVVCAETVLQFLDGNQQVIVQSGVEDGRIELYVRLPSAAITHIEYRILCLAEPTVTMTWIESYADPTTFTSRMEYHPEGGYFIVGTLDIAYGAEPNLDEEIGFRIYYDGTLCAFADTGLMF